MSPTCHSKAPRVHQAPRWVEASTEQNIIVKGAKIREVHDKTDKDFCCA